MVSALRMLALLLAGHVSATGHVGWRRLGSLVRMSPRASSAAGAVDPAGREQLAACANGLDTLADALCAGLLEREEHCRLLLLAAVAGEHLLLIGPPGTGKSEIARRLAAALAEGQGRPYFGLLLTRFTTPEEVFGPLSLQALQRDAYVRMVDGYLPTARVAFLDEVFKASSAILNALLTVLNERTFTNGATTLHLPLRSAVAASNELPESDDLDALFDRFLLRVFVPPLSDAAMLDALDEAPAESLGAQGPRGRPEVVATLQAVTTLIDAGEEVRTTLLPRHVQALMVDVRRFVREELGGAVSDRRMLRTARLLRVSACTQGRRAVSALDCELLAYTLAPDPSRAGQVRDFVRPRSLPGPARGELMFVLSQLATEARDLLRRTGGEVRADRGVAASDARTVDRLCTDARALLGVVEADRRALAVAAVGLEEGGGARAHLWLGRGVAQAAVVELRRRRDALATDMRTLVDAVTGLIALVDDGVDLEAGGQTGEVSAAAASQAARARLDAIDALHTTIRVQQRAPAPPAPTGRRDQGTQLPPPGPGPAGSGSLPSTAAQEEADDDFPPEVLALGVKEYKARFGGARLRHFKAAKKRRAREGL